MRISDWNSDVCSSDLYEIPADVRQVPQSAGAAAVLQEEAGDFTAKGIQLAADAFWHQAHRLVQLLKHRQQSPSRFFRLLGERSEERSVGKECVSTFSCRWSRYP